jgi:hypothetical protein
LHKSFLEKKRDDRKKLMEFEDKKFKILTDLLIDKDISGPINRNK